MDRVTRRAFVAHMSAAAIASPALCYTAGARAFPVATETSVSKTCYLFFSADEASFIETACERLLVHDTAPPGMLGRQIAGYVDGQLAGPWGAGQALFRSGPWQPGMTATSLASLSPGALFRGALNAINHYLDTQGTHFSALDPRAQRLFLRELAAGAIPLGAAPATVFFELLLAMAVEGLFVATAHAPHVGLIAWPLTAFPGAYFRPAGRSARNPAAMSHSQR